MLVLPIAHGYSMLNDLPQQNCLDICKIFLIEGAGDGIDQ